MMTEYLDYAEYYDNATPFWDDIPFYLESAQAAGSPVLELACGTGRVLIPLAKAGFKIYGIDISTNMLSICRRKVQEQGMANDIFLMQADMSNFALPRNDFRFAYIALRSFMHLYTQADQLACLSQVYKHLSPGAYFIIDLYAPVFEQLAQNQETTYHIKQEFDLPNGNHVIRRDRQVWIDLANQIKHLEVRFEEYLPTGELFHERTLPLNTRYTFRYELTLLLERAGFQCLEIFRDYERNPYDGTGEIIVVARRPE